MLDHEAAETPHLDALVARKRFGHAVEHRVDHDFGVAPREPRIDLDHLVDQLAFGHLPALWVGLPATLLRRGADVNPRRVGRSRGIAARRSPRGRPPSTRSRVATTRG